MILTETKPAQSLKALIQSHQNYPGPCLTIVMNTSGGGVDYRMHLQRLKNKLGALAQREDLPSDQREKLESILNQAGGVLEDSKPWSGNYEAICFHACSDIAHLHRLSEPVPEEYGFAGKHFLYRSLLPEFESAFDGYAFHLSLKQPRIYKVSGNRVEEIEESGLPKDIYDLTDTDAIDGGQRAHVRQSRQKSAPEMVSQGVDSNESTRENNFPAFMRQVLHALQDLNLNPDKPIACIGDHKILAHFTEAFTGENPLHEITNAESPLTEKALIGICGQEGSTAYANRKTSLLEKFQGGDLPAQLINDNLKEIYEGARQGRIARCMIAGNAFAWCRYDEETATLNTVDENTADLNCMEVYDRILVETLEKDGEVHSLRQDEMPEGKSILAVLRW